MAILPVTFGGFGFSNRKFFPRNREFKFRGENLLTDCYPPVLKHDVAVLPFQVRQFGRHLAWIGKINLQDSRQRTGKHQLPNPQG
jgi:hypothetical protein